MLKPSGLKCEYLINPLGVDAVAPRLCWILASDERAQTQSAFPANTSATLYMPAAETATVTESGIPADLAQAVEFMGREGETLVYAVGSGEYHFAAFDQEKE